MTRKIVRLKVADILPLQDEYGNEFAQRDYGLQVNKDYVEELARSFGPSGEPEENITVIEEDGKHYVRAGRSRLEAMKLLGTEECWAVLDDDTSLRAAIETVVRTDKKKKYEDVELSGFVQQLAAFGDDAYVSEVASIDVDKAARVRKAREIAGERAVQLSLDRLYVLPDFEGDEDAVKRLIEAPEEKWRRVSDELHRVKENAEKVAAFKARAAELKIKVVDERPSGLRYACQCSDLDDLEADYMAVSVRFKGLVLFISDSWYVEANFYGTPLGQEQETEEEAERRRKADGYKEIAQQVDDACFNWVLEQLGGSDALDSLTIMKNLDDACRKVAVKCWYISEVVKLFPQIKKEEPCLVLFAVGYKQSRRYLSSYAGDLARETMSDIAAERIGEAIDWVDLHIADGWEPDEGMLELLDLAREKAAADAPDDDEADE